MGASPCLSPYLAFHSWTGALIAIVSSAPATAAVVVGLWILMFVHPGMTLLLVWLGLIVLAVAVGIGRLLTRTEEAAARRDYRLPWPVLCRGRVVRQ